MKKLTLQFGGVKEMLTREQMKKINGGTDFSCYKLNSDGTWGAAGSVNGDNCCQAQAACDTVAWGSVTGIPFPYGCDCPCAMDC